MAEPREPKAKQPREGRGGAGARGEGRGAPQRGAKRHVSEHDEAQQRALRAANAEGLDLRRDMSLPSGFVGVSGYGMADAIKYRATLAVPCDARGKRRLRVLGANFGCAEEAALCVARAEKAMNARGVTALRF